MSRQKDYSLLLLAGGQSSRMGRDKAELLYEGKTFTEQLIEKGEHLGIREKFLSGHASPMEGIRVVADLYPKRGPLGGMQACMARMTTPYCLILPVDVPQIPLSLLEKLLQYHELLTETEKGRPLLLKHGDRVEPLIGIYPASMAETIEKIIQKGSAPVFRVLKEQGYQCYAEELPGWQTDNINTPQAYEELLTHEGKGEGQHTPFLAAVSGVKNSGKTTFLEKLIPILREKGYRVAVIKHDGHDFDGDVKDTDTWRLKKSGAYGTGIFSGNRWMVVKEQPWMDEQQLAALFPEADMILLEGFKNSVYPKFEIVRSGISKESVCQRETLMGLVTDTDLKIPGVPCFGLEEAAACAEVLEERMKQKRK